MVIPSFSIVLETENLANADIEGLVKSLVSLERQDVSPESAKEVWLIESGDTPLDLLERLCQEYPWIKIYQAPLNTGYYKAKMLGAELSTGEVVVYFDSDCIYEPQWLRTLLTPFAEDETIQVVAGETMTRGVGMYGTAMAIAYIFPPFSGQSQRCQTQQYFLNNVAFRRDFLLKHPIPLDLPLYRGNCDLHARDLIRDGYEIWKQPQARATHAPPSSLSHFFWRFLLIGHDYYWQTQLAAEKNLQSQDELKGAGGKLQVFRDRFNKMLAEDRRHLWYFPLAVPIALSSATLVAAGYFITAWKPHFLLATYEQTLMVSGDGSNAFNR